MKKQKILLVNPPIRVTAKPGVFPSGLGYIAAVLLKDGYDVQVLDINGHRYDKETVRKKLAEFLNIGNIDVVGIGCLITCYNYVKWLIKTIKEINPNTKVIVGGGLGSSIPEICIDKLKADIVVIGEGEITIADLLNTLQIKSDLEKVKGIAFKKGDKIVRTLPRERIKNLDELPFPAWHLFPMDIYLQNQFEVEAIMDIKGKSMNVIGGKGCPFNCTFCYELFSHKAIKRSVNNVIDEIKVLQKRYGVKVIGFMDDLFAMDKNWVMEFCDEINKQDIKLKWFCAARVNTVDEEMLKKMKEAGCILVNFGIESGSQKMLDIMNKAVRVEQASKAINTARKVGLRLNTSFMMGFPEETKESLDETIKFCIDNNVHLTTIFFVTPYPGTALYKQAKDMGLIKNEEEYISSLGNATEFTINLTKWSDEELFKMRDYVISSVHKAYFWKNKLEYIQWLRKKAIWGKNYIRVNGLKAFVNAKLGKIKSIIKK